MVKKPNCILDLDQTLISGEAEEDYDFNKYKNKAKKFQYKNIDGYYIIFERPGLQNFLDFLFANFNVSIWTAASKDYALFIVENIIMAGKTNRTIDWFFFSYHCNISKRIKKGSKDLSILWDEYGIPGYSAYNTVIIDDNNDVYKTQKNNCIVAVPFEFTDKGSENDDYLERLQPNLVSMKKSIIRGDDNPAELVNSALKLLE